MYSRTFTIILLSIVAIISSFIFTGTVLAQTTTTTVLQPAYDANNYNRIIYGVNPDLNYPINEQVMLGFQNSEIALMRFDMSAIPNDAIINSATLSLTLYGMTQEFPFTIRRVLVPWKDNEVTYNHRTATNAWTIPGATSFNYDVSSTVLGTGLSFIGVNNIQLNATEMQEMLSNNFGMWFHKDGDDNNFAVWYMMTDLNPSNRPKLTIQYSVPRTGDANNDGIIDNADYSIWLTHFGQSTTKGTSGGDFNKDGIVDGVDYVVWATLFGT